MAEWFTAQLSRIFIMLGISATPLIELRGAIPYGAAMGVPFWENIMLCIIGNMIPVPFIILFIRKIFDWLRAKELVERQIAGLERRVLRKSDMVKKYELLGLILFVAIPLPGTGAWSGALLAALMDIRLRSAIPAILIGVVIAGFLVGGVSYGFINFLNFMF